jgi:nitrate/nitrite transporter NarK
MSVVGALQVVLGLCSLLDVGIFIVSQTYPALLIEKIPQAGASDVMFTRLFGCFILMCGIARAHGGMNVSEKGAYRVALWSFIIEIVHIALELHHGTMDMEKHKLMVVFAVCGGMALWMTLMYKSILYPAGKARKD